MPEPDLPLFGHLAPTPEPESAALHQPRDVPSDPTTTRGGPRARSRRDGDHRVVLAQGRIAPRQSLAEAVRTQQVTVLASPRATPDETPAAPLPVAPAPTVPDWVRRLMHGTPSTAQRSQSTAATLAQLQPVEHDGTRTRGGRAPLPGTMPAPTLGTPEPIRPDLANEERYTSTHRANALRRAESHRKARGTGRYVLVGLVAAFLGATQSVLSRRDAGRALLEDLRTIEAATKRLRAQEAEARQLWQYTASRPAMAKAAAALQLTMPADSQIILWPVVQRSAAGGTPEIHAPVR